MSIKFQDSTLSAYPLLALIMHHMYGESFPGVVLTKREGLSNPENHLIAKVLNPEDVFVFPVGLIHFQFNVGKTNAVAFVRLSSQNPGVNNYHCKRSLWITTAD
ncbi:hypothetical protein NC651_039685 [Populus alba x Populus x berolinensis]|nr:hypothetical protein NC651_039685 [Populus alba x Populus x berolinensis]